MSRKGWFIIAGVVVATHLLVFFLLMDKRVLPERKYIAPANFSGVEAVIDGDHPGEKWRIRQFRVSTDLATEEEIARAEKKIKEWQDKYDQQPTHQ